MTSGPVCYLSGKQVAQRLGIKPDTWASYRSRGYTPEPDVMIGDIAGWLPETVDGWLRPGQGARTISVRGQTGTVIPPASHETHRAVLDWNLPDVPPAAYVAAQEALRDYLVDMDDSVVYSALDEPAREVVDSWLRLFLAIITEHDVATFRALLDGQTPPQP